MPLDLSLALGSHAMTPLKVASAYNILANGGYQVKPYLLSAVVDRKGNVIYQALPDTVCATCAPVLAKTSSDDITSDAQSLASDVENVDLQLEELLNSLAQESLQENEQQSVERIKQALKKASSARPPAARVIDAQTAFLIDSMLKDVILRGTGVKAKVLNRPDLAGKTGTTNGPRDAWFSGYSPHLTVSTWVGFDDNTLLGRNEYGGSAALPIWIDFMGEALKDKAVAQRPLPDGIVMVKIDAKTGARISADQEGIFEYFRAQDVPELTGDGLMPGKTENGLPDDLF